MIDHKSLVGRLPVSLTVILMLMALVSIPLQANTSYSFYLGNQPSPVPAENGEAAGPYPGTITDTTTNKTLPFGQFMCLDGNVVTYWGSTLTGGTVTHPADQQEDEAAFLASLLLSDAAQQGVTLPSASAPGPSPSYTQAFIDGYSGAITFAIWDIMKTLPGGVTEPSGAQAFVTDAQQEYTNVFNNSSSADYAAGQAFLASVDIFNPYPVGSAQRFITMNPAPDPTPEPGTLGSLAAGLLLAALCLRQRRLAETKPILAPSPQRQPPIE